MQNNGYYSGFISYIYILRYYLNDMKIYLDVSENKRILKLSFLLR